MAEEKTMIVYSVTIVGDEKAQKKAEDAWCELQKNICEALAGKAGISFTQSNRGEVK